MTHKLTLMMTLASLIVCRAVAFYNPVVEDRKIDIDVDSDYNGAISDADDSIETSKGGIVIVGGWTNITIQQTINTAVPGDPNTVRLSWLKEHIEIAESSGGTAITPDGYMDTAQTTPYKDYPGLNSTKTLWVHGISTSHTARAEAIRLELIHFDDAYDPNSHDEIAMTVIDVDKIEYRRLDQSDQTAWVTELAIAGGAIDTKVHKAKIRVKIKPVVDGVTVKVDKNGGNGDATAGTIDPTTAQTTDANGEVFFTYLSSDKEEDLTIRVTELAGTTVAIDLNSKIRQTWDAGTTVLCSWPTYYELDTPFELSISPTLEVVEGVGAITGHTVTNFADNVKVYWESFDIENQSIADGGWTDTFVYPDYLTLPFSLTISSLITIEATTETTLNTSGKYKTTHTVTDYWEFDDTNWLLNYATVEEYDPMFADMTLVCP